jgi:hypothetical protein
MSNASVTAKPEKAARKPRPLLAFYCENDNDPETGEVVFAKTNGAARAAYASSNGYDFNDAHSVTRRRQFDAYAPGPVPVRALLEDGWWMECMNCGRRLCFGDDDTWVHNHDIADLKEHARHNAEVDVELAAFDKSLEEPLPPLPEDRFARMFEEDRRANPKTFRRRILDQKYPELLDANALRYVGTNHVFCNVACQQSLYERAAKMDLEHEKAEQDAARLFPEGEGFKSGRWPTIEARVEFNVPGLKYPVEWWPKDGPDVARVTNHDREAWQELMARRPKPKEMIDGASQDSVS